MFFYDCDFIQMLSSVDRMLFPVVLNGSL